MGLSTGRVQAQTRILLLEQPAEERPGLLSELRIQLSGVAEVQTSVAQPAPSLPARVAAATELSRREQARLAIWVEGPIPAQDGSAGDAVLYLVGQREGRAMVEVVHVPGGGGPELDRTLALKVRVAVDELERARTTSPSGAVLAPKGSEAPGSRWGAVLGLGALFGPLQGATAGQWGGHVRAGPWLSAEPFRFSLEAGLAWFPALRIESFGDSVRMSELAPGLALHAQLREQAIWLGARAGMSRTSVQAQGRSRAGTQGAEVHERLVAFESGIDVELPIAAGFGLEAALLVQVWLDRQRFAVDQQEIVDLGRVRPLARVSVTWAAPASP